jgi:hypothetical protein
MAADTANLMSVPIMLGSPAVGIYWAHTTFNVTWELPTAIGTYFAAVLVGFVMLTILAGQSLTIVQSVGVSGTVVVLAALGATASVNGALTTPEIAYVVLPLCVTVAITVLYYLLVTIMLSSIERLQTRRHPHERLLADLVALVSEVQGYRAQQATANDKRRVLQKLEAVAMLVEWAIPRVLKSGDSATDNWLREKTRQMAGSIRSLKREVVLPSDASNEPLVSTLTEALSVACGGDWGNMAMAEMQPPSARARWLSVVDRVWRVLLGGLPLAGFAAWQLGSRALEGALANTIWGVTVLWAVLSLASLDPLYAQKLDIAVKLIPGRRE